MVDAYTLRLEVVRLDGANQRLRGENLLHVEQFRGDGSVNDFLARVERHVLHVRVPDLAEFRDDVALGVHGQPVKSAVCALDEQLAHPKGYDVRLVDRQPVYQQFPAQAFPDDGGAGNQVLDLRVVDVRRADVRLGDVRDFSDQRRDVRPRDIRVLNVRGRQLRHRDGRQVGVQLVGGDAAGHQLPDARLHGVDGVGLERKDQRFRDECPGDGSFLDVSGLDSSLPDLQASDGPVYNPVAAKRPRHQLESWHTAVWQLPGADSAHLEAVDVADGDLVVPAGQAVILVGGDL